MSVTIFNNPYNVPCQTYICHNISSWFIGIENGPLNTAYTLCGDCVAHMLENLPLELMPDGPQKELRIKVEEQAEFLKAAKEALAEQLKAVPPVVEELLEEKAEEPEQEEAPVQPSAIEQLEAKTTYRCLECGAEFGDKRGLSNHMRGKHKEG